MSVEEGNKLIAVFMGLDEENDEYPESVPGELWGDFFNNEIKYHTSWDWLLPVVEKIESMRGVGAVVISRDHCWISDDKEPADNENIVPANLMRKSKIEAVWLAVIEFINLYNQQKYA